MPAREDDDVPPLWRDPDGPAGFDAAVALGLAARKQTWPYAIALCDSAGEISWKAPNFAVRGNVLVSWDYYTGSETAEKADVTFAALVAVTGRLARWRIPLTLTTWLLGSTEDIVTIHREIGDVLGVTKRSLTVVDLASGRGIGWDAVHGIMTEIEPAMPS